MAKKIIFENFWGPRVPPGVKKLNFLKKFENMDLWYSNDSGRCGETKNGRKNNF
jgi:hypothetical protein